MVEMKEWVPFQEIDWDCPNNNVFWIDTRDFHAGYRWQDEPHKDFDKLKKYPRFFFTKEKLVALLERYFTQSGGDVKWRFFNLEGVENWNMKYIRIARTGLGFIVCDQNWKALPEDFLARDVEQEHLNDH
jgi:hypothetical protein